jgi:nucleoid-associated protein YgaU
MSRYAKTKIRQSNGKHFRGTTYYKEVLEKDTDEYFIAQHGDRLDNLALRFYGDINLWWFIGRVNNINTMNIPAGTEIRIPASVEDARGY